MTKPVEASELGRAYRLTPPDMHESLRCGICEALMSVQRGVEGPTCWADAAGRRTRRHDRFECPNLDRPEHRRAGRLMDDRARTASRSLRRLLGGDVRDALRGLRGS